MVPRLHFVKKARKDNPAVKKGESYYWWKWRFRLKQYSRTRPRRSQMTQSDFLGQIYDLEDGLSSEGISVEEVQDFCTTLEDLRSQCEESLQNMPEHLQETSMSGQILQDRIEGLEEWGYEIESLDESMTDEERLEALVDANPGF